jgi:hypothetical protein
MKQVICIDLDGTLIYEDVTWCMTLKCLRTQPWQVLRLVWWFCHGMAHYKSRLATTVCLEPQTLTYNQPLQQWIQAQKDAGYQIVLATGAAYTGFFDAVLASDGRTNLKGKTKAATLCMRYGEEGFIYAGNSRDDLMVWTHAAAILIVNAKQWVKTQALALGKPTQILKG